MALPAIERDMLHFYVCDFHIKRGYMRFGGIFRFHASRMPIASAFRLSLVVTLLAFFIRRQRRGIFGAAAAKAS